jgi:hypothetical protein
MNDLFSPASAAGTIVLALIASGIVGLARAYRQQLMAGLTRWLGRSQAVRHLLLPIADTLIPSWREDLRGDLRAQRPVGWRIQMLRHLKRPAYVVVGGVYLDLELSPIDVVRLDDAEFYDLNTVNMKCGGSVLYFGRSLHELFHIRSFLFTRLGKGDPFSKALGSKLRAEAWIRNPHTPESPNTQCGVSVHLVRRQNDYHTTFTNTGTLSALQWGPMWSKLQGRTKRGGVLYIAGYFRTGLHADFSRLEQLSSKLLICLEHGRFSSTSNPAAASALLEAFRNLVDVYLCTPPELRELMKSNGVLVDAQTHDREALEYFASQAKLPPITVVRGRAEVGGQAVAHILYDNKVTDVSAPCHANVTKVGYKSVFNATFVHALVTGDPGDSTEDIVHSATREALDTWAGFARKDRNAARH